MKLDARVGSDLCLLAVNASHSVQVMVSAAVGGPISCWLLIIKSKPSRNQELLLSS